MSQLKPGDLVRLKSGSPLMTVEAVEEDKVYCTWFNDKGERRDERFLAAQLRTNED